MKRPMTRFLTTEEFAEMARTSASTVRYWRHIGKGPKGVKRGRRVLYSETAVDEWLTGAPDTSQVSSAHA